MSSAIHRLNAGITFSGTHDSVVGWSTLASPSIGYSFNDVFSVDATLPIFGFHAQFFPPFAQYQTTVAVTAPTGDETYGLTTGRVTFDLTNHFERTYGRLTPSLELGVGDSSTLINRTVNKNYTSLGPLAHFQTGLGVNLFHDAFFESDVYEQLPIGDQKIYGPSRKGRPTVVTGHNVTEDNGFTNSLAIPIDRRASISAYYSRSLRLRIDSVAFGVTYVLRSPPPSPLVENLDDLFR
jgi:hypothetical protein